MTDRLKGCTVVFKSDIREDDAESVLNAIRMVKGVSRVEPVLTDGSDMITEMRLDDEVAQFFYDAAKRWRDRHKAQKG